MGSLMGVFRRAFDTFIEAVETRMDLFSLELQEEKIRVVHIVLWTCASVFLSAIALVMVTFTLILAVGEEHQVVAMVICSAVYLVAAGICGYKLYGSLYQRQKPFAETIEQLRQDRNRLRGCLKKDE